MTKRNKIINIILVGIYLINLIIGIVFYTDRKNWEQKYYKVVEINHSYDKVIKERNECLETIKTLTKVEK